MLGGRKCRGPVIRKLPVNSYKMKLGGFFGGEVRDGYESIWETRVVPTCVRCLVQCGFFRKLICSL